MRKNTERFDLGVSGVDKETLSNVYFEKIAKKFELNAVAINEDAGGNGIITFIRNPVSEMYFCKFFDTVLAIAEELKTVLDLGTVVITKNSVSVDTENFPVFVQTTGEILQAIKSIDEDDLVNIMNTKEEYFVKRKNEKKCLAETVENEELGAAEIETTKIDTNKRLSFFKNCKKDEKTKNINRLKEVEEGFSNYKEEQYGQMRVSF